MKKNVGSADRAIRIVAGLIIIGIYFKSWIFSINLHLSSISKQYRGFWSC